MSEVKFAVGYRVLGDPVELDELCSKCLHSTLLSFPVHFVGEVGVIQMPDRVECYACWDWGGWRG